MDRYIQYMYSYPHKTAYRPLQGVDIRDYMTSLEGEGHGLYLHLPFCESKCGYCNLFSAAGCGRAYMDAYLDVMERQMQQYKGALPGDTVFRDFTIGGGTPLLLDVRQLERMFRAAGDYMPLGKDCEIIIETAPKQTDKEKVRLLKELKTTRVSMGIQSFEEKELEWLGRQHDRQRALAAAELLADTGFGCVNFDFIYGLPGQNGESLIRSLKRAVSFSPDEIFLYPLYIKHGVRMEREGKGAVLDSGHTFRLYQRGAAYLKEQGYRQLSMRRFIRERDGIHGGFQECGFTGALALGCGGRSYLGRLHICTPYRTTRKGIMEEIERYLAREDFFAAADGIVLSDEELKRRYVIKHLLIRPGISKGAYRRDFGADAAADFPVFRMWTERGWLEDAGEFLALTEEGLGLSDYLGPQLISEEIRKKMLEWERINGQEDNFLQGESEKL